MTTRDVETQIASLLHQLIPPPRSLPVYAIGDRLRVVSDSRAGPKAPKIGCVGTVAAVIPKSEAQIVYHNCLDRVYLLDFGPDEDGPGGRDTWAFADGDVQAADALWKGQRGKRK